MKEKDGDAFSFSNHFQSLVAVREWGHQDSCGEIAGRRFNCNLSSFTEGSTNKFLESLISAN